MKPPDTLYLLLYILFLKNGVLACYQESCPVGTVRCRHAVTTGPEVDENTCGELAVSEYAGMKLFFELNPQLDKDCTKIKPNTEYCVMGCVCEAPRPKPAVGEVMCRFHSQPTGSDVNQDTCKELADHYQASMETFFKVNPQLDKDCKTIKPNTVYCVAGCE